MQIKIIWMLIVVGFLAVVFAGLRTGSAIYASFCFTGTFSVLLAAILNTILSKRSDRAYWLAFAMFGWAFFITSQHPWLRDSFAAYLSTRYFIAWAYPLLCNLPPPGGILDPETGQVFTRSPTSGGSQLILWGWDTKPAFACIVNCVGTWVFGFLGMAYVWAYRIVEDLRFVAPNDKT